MDSFGHRVRKMSQVSDLINGILQHNRVDLRSQCSQKRKEQGPVNHRSVRSDKWNKLFINAE